MTVPSLPPWFFSPHDEKWHLVRREVSETVEALCEHSAPKNTRADGDDDGPRCEICILMWGMELADRFGDPGNYVG